MEVEINKNKDEGLMLCVCGNPAKVQRNGDYLCWGCYGKFEPGECADEAANEIIF